MNCKSHAKLEWPLSCSVEGMSITLQQAAQNVGDEKMKASVEVLKVLTENKAKALASADAKERERLRATAKNIAMRAEQLVKTSQKIGG